MAQDHKTLEIETTLDSALANLRSRKGRNALAATHTSLTNEFVASLFTSLIVQILGFFVSMGAAGPLIVGLLIAFLFSPLMSTAASYALGLTLSALGTSAWLAWKAFRKKDSDEARDFPGFYGRPNSEMLDVMLQGLARLAPWAETDAALNWTWEDKGQVRGSRLTASVPLRDGGSAQVTVDEEPLHLGISLVLAPDEGPESGTSLALSRTNRLHPWKSTRNKPVPDPALHLGEHFGHFIAQRQPTLSPETQMVSVKEVRRRATTCDNFDTIEASLPLNPRYEVPTRGASAQIAKTTLAGHIGYWSAYILSLLPAAWLASASFDMLGGSSRQLTAGMFGLFFLYFFIIAQITFARLLNPLNDTRIIRKIRARPPHRGSLILEKNTLSVDGQWIDLQKPFRVNLQRSPENQPKGTLVVELVSTDAQSQGTRLRFGVPLQPSEDQSTIPQLDLTAPCLDGARFIEDVWPVIAAWSQIHGHPLDIDFEVAQIHAIEPQRQAAEAFATVSSG